MTLSRSRTQLDNGTDRSFNFKDYDTFTKNEQTPTFETSKFRQKHRFIVLVLNCLICFGGYFCMDQPNALSKHIDEELTGGSSMKYNMLYSFYSWPNIILPFFSGIFIDRMGLKVSCTILFILCIVGQGFFTLGGYNGSGGGFTLSIIGRTIFGMGNESLCIVQNIFANKWFKGKELAFAMALSMSIGRLGSTANNFLMPVIASSAGLGTALLFGLILIMFSYLVTVSLLMLEKKAEKTDAVRNDVQANENIDFSYVRKFPLSFWIITISCVSIYTSIFSFNNISNNFFMNSYDFDLKTAARLTSVVFIIAAIS